MQINIAGKQMELGEALQERISAGLEAAVSKYFDRTGEAHVTVSKQGHTIDVDCHVHLPSGITLHSSGSADDSYAALEQALEKMEKRVRRYKRRLKDHHRPDRTPFPAEPALSTVLQANEEPEEAEESKANGTDHHPLTVAETAAIIRTMSVSEAVMQLELGEAPALMFRNAATGGHNMVYRRPDGHIGWVNPDGASNA